MAKNPKLSGENSAGDRGSKFQSRRAALQAQLALLDQEEKTALKKLERAGTERLVAAMDKETFGTVSKGDATKFAKLVAKLGFASALARLEQSNG